MVILLSEPYPTDNEAMAVCCRKPKLSLLIMLGPDLKDPSVWCQLATKGLLCVNRVPVSPRDASDKTQAKLSIAESWVPLIVDLCSRANVIAYMGSSRPAGYEPVLRMDNCHRCRQPVLRPILELANSSRPRVEGSPVRSLRLGHFEAAGSEVPSVPCSGVF